MKNAPKPDHLSLQSLIGRLREGAYVIPDFQREFEWEPRDILELMRSLFLDYYIGSLLLWRGNRQTFESLACEPLRGFRKNGVGDPAHIVLDGQQRLTAMYYAFMAPDMPAPKRKNRYLYFIRIDRFVDDETDEAFVYEWTRYGTNLLANPSAQYESHTFPLATVGDSDMFAIPTWFMQYKAHWESKRDGAVAQGRQEDAEEAIRHIERGEEFSAHLQEMMRDYQISFIELDQELEIDRICDTFTRINSQGIRLDVFDLMNALLKPKGLQLKHMWREIEDDLEFIASDRADVYVLQVMSIMAQDYCSPKYLYYLLPGERRRIRQADGTLRDHVLVESTDEFLNRWNTAVASIRKGIERIRHPQNYGAISPRFLPYVSILPAFCSALEAAEAAPAETRLAAARKVRDWYWASVFTNRYSGSVESTTARDVLDVKRWIDNDDAVPDVVPALAERIRSIDLRSETKKGTSVYNGILNLMIVNGAKDWLSDAAPSPNDVDDHHIIPKWWGREEKLGSRIDSILNRAPISAETNREVIAEQLPNEYLPKWMEQAGEDVVRDTLGTHFLSGRCVDILLKVPFGRAEFEEFLAERQRTVLGALDVLLIKGRLDLSPDLREMDRRIEAVELLLRVLIAERLDNDVAALPSRVKERIDERYAAVRRKQPGLEESERAGLESMIEYADLSELYDTIVNKGLWSLFQPPFAAKPLLEVRFGQLIEVRNAIRHSRRASPVVKKDGEAAILWFEQALADAD